MIAAAADFEYAPTGVETEIAAEIAAEIEAEIAADEWLGPG